MKLSQFFTEEYVDQASYSNLRMIASLMDGQKNSSRKILHTVLQKNIKEKIKVSQLGSKVAEFTEYLHGNLDGVIVNLGTNYTGSNNLPLLQKKGNFGTRFSQSSSASRYIYAYGHKNLFDLFKKEDFDILNQQTFEGTKIEPQFFVPNLPLLLINGSEGLSSGFAQKILPRDPSLITRYIKNSLNGKSNKNISLTPSYSGFNGNIIQGDNNSQWLISGKIKRLNSTKVEISEVPIGYDLKRYINVLDDLEDKGIIKSYKDLCENDNFKFEVNFTAANLKSMSDETLITKLKLAKKVSENYTVMNENNKIEVFNSIEEILNRYIEVKLQFMEKRKLNVLNKLKVECDLLKSKYVYIQRVITEKLIINKRKKIDIEKDLSTIQGVIKHNGSYNYLLNMPMISVTEEKLMELENQIKTNEFEIQELSNTSIQQMWLKEL